MQDTAKTYQAILHNIAALGRMERQVVADICKHPEGTEERRDRILILRSVWSNRGALQSHAQEFRRRLLRELPDFKPRALAAEMRPVTQAEIEAMIARVESERAAEEGPEDRCKRRQAELEAAYSELAGVQSLPEGLRRRIGPV